MTITRIDDCVYRDGKLIGVFAKGRWHRFNAADRELIPLEPLLSERDGRDLEDCVRAQPAEIAQGDPIADEQRRRIRLLYGLLSTRALEKIRRKP